MASVGLLQCEKIAKFKLAFVENREAVVGQLSEFGTELKKFMDLEAIHSLEMFLEWFSKIEEKSASKNTKSCHHSLKSKSKKKVSTINQYEDLQKLVNEDGTPSSNVDEDSDEETESTEGSSVEESSTSWQTISSDEDSTSDNADSNEDSKEDQNEGVPLLMTDEDDTEESEDESSEDEENKEKLGPFEQLVDDACYLSVFTLILIKQLQQTKDEEIEVLKLLLNKSRAEIERMRSIEKKEYQEDSIIGILFTLSRIRRRHNFLPFPMCYLFVFLLCPYQLQCLIEIMFIKKLIKNYALYHETLCHLLFLITLLDNQWKSELEYLFCFSVKKVQRFRS